MHHNIVKSIAFGLVMLLSLFAGQMAHSNAQTPTSGKASDNQQTVTVSGFGQASAPTERVVVRIFTGGETVYGPAGPTYQVPNEEELAIVVKALVDLGIDANTLFTNTFAATSFAPVSGQSGEVRFTYDRPAELIPLLTQLQEQLKQKRGPTIAQVLPIFLPADCGAVEQEAMANALANARERAERMAEQAKGRLGALVAVKEAVSTLTSPAGPVGGCAALEAAANATTIYPYPATGNTPQIVNIGITVEATYMLEPRQP